MGTVFPSTIPVPLWLVVADIIILIAVSGIAFFIFMFASQIPNAWAQIVSQIKRRPTVLMHYSNRKAEMFSPKRAGKKGQQNTLTLPNSLGAKFDPSGAGLEEVWGKSPYYNYYSKAAFPTLPVYAKAATDFVRFCGEKGIMINAELIDALVVENLDITDVYTAPLQDMVLKNLPLPIKTEKEALLDETLIISQWNTTTTRIDELTKLRDQTTDKDELNDIDKELTVCSADLKDIEARYNSLDELRGYKKQLQATIEQINKLKSDKDELVDAIDIMTGYLDPDTRETKYTLTRLKEDLNKLVIREGLFVFPKIHDFVFAASALNSSGIQEAISIARADAYAQVQDDNRGWTMENIAMLVVLIIVLFVGGALAYKMAFGN